jgi:transposase
VPRNWGTNTTLLAALTQQGITAALVVESAVDRLIFEAFVERVLAPTLRPGQIVIWDNLSAHHSARAEQVLAARGCELIWLPPYSPDRTPIEQAFAKIKSAVRRANARARDDLWDAIGAAIATVTSTDAIGWFTHCGYYTPPHYFWNWV